MAQEREELWDLGPNIIRYIDSQCSFHVEATEDKIEDLNKDETIFTTDYEQEFDSLLDNEDFSSDEQSENYFIGGIDGFTSNHFNHEEETSEAWFQKDAWRNDKESSEDYQEWSSDEDSSSQLEGLYNTNADNGIILYRLNSKNSFGDKQNPQLKLAKWIDDLNRKADYIHVNIPLEIVVKEEYNHDMNRVVDPFISLEDPFFKKNIIEAVDSTSSTVIEKINGTCLVRMRNGDELHGNFRRGKREGLGGISGSRLDKMNIRMITGTYVSGVLTGLGRIIMKDESVSEGWFQQGFLHGPVKGLVRGPNSSTSPSGPICHLSWVGWYRAGLPVGTCWSSLMGDGWIVGKCDIDGKLTGNRIAFIYPDLVTALVGKFNNGVLVSAVPGKIVAVSKVNGVMVPEIKVTSNEEYKFWRSSKDDIMCPPHRKDVYEDQLVYVGKSTMPGSGEGLFAKVSIPQGTLIAYYNGIIFKPDDHDPYVGENTTGYSIMIESVKPWQKDNVESDHMDILPKYQSYEDYSSTSGHKINHSFNPNCDWADAVHPCYERIPAIRTIFNIEQGEELFIHYMIDMEEAKQWYKDVWENFSLK